MRIKLLLAVIFLLASTHSAFAAGGACPTSASYLNTTNPTSSLVTLASQGITSCFYIAANGSDSNNGTSETTPWLHAPGMSSCTGSCASNAPSGGTGYIFRGGDTWHFGSSGASPYTNGWNWSFNGKSQSSPIYLGVDPNWYSGSSWARPTLSGDNPTKACPGAGPCTVASCVNASINGAYNQMISFNSTVWNVFDDFEITGFCWNNETNVGNGGNVMISYYSGAGQGTITPYFFVPERLYVHGWSHAAGSTQNGASGIAGNSGYGGVVLQFNIIDGSDSDDTTLSPLGMNDTDAYILRYNVFSHVGGDQVMSDCHQIHDNIFEYWNFETDGSGHGDVMFCENEINGGAANPNLFYNNIWRYVGTTYGQSISYMLDMGTPSGQTDYIFNNITHDDQPTNAGGYWNDEDSHGSWVLFNNIAPMPGGNCCVGNASTPVTAVNNHWIGISSMQGFQNASVATETNGLYMSYATALTQGYASANDFGPTASSNSTATALGTNETSGYCLDSVLHDATAEAACAMGTTGGCAYITSNHTLSCPSYTPNARPSSGAWNVGAFQYSTVTSSVQPPTNVTVVVQ